MQLVRALWGGSADAKPVKYFGQGLEEISAHTRASHKPGLTSLAKSSPELGGHGHRNEFILPSFLIKAVAFLDEHSSTEYLFRQSATAGVVNEYITRIESGEVIDFSQDAKCRESPHIVSDLIKRFLAMLPDQLMTAKYQPQFVSIVKTTPNIHDLLDKLRETIELLPPKNAALLDFIISLLSRIAATSDKNKMTASSLAVCLAPTLFRYDTTPGDLKEIEAQTSACIRVIELMIKDQSAIFRVKFHALSNSMSLAPVTALHQIQNRKEHKKGVNILTLDGGGMRGVIEIKILSLLAEEMFGDCDLNGTQKLLSKFDLMAGTSTGAIIALALQKKSLKQVKDFYYELGSKIFQSGIFWTIGRWLRYYSSGDYYNSEALQEVFTNFFGTDLIKHYTQPTMPKLFLVSTDASNSMWQPFVFRTYSNPQSQIAGTSSTTVPLSLRASTAAPTYFSQVVVELPENHAQTPPIPVENTGAATSTATQPSTAPVPPKTVASVVTKICVDGGMVANNPTELAIFEAHHMYPETNINCIVSIGTGLPSNSGGSVNLLRMLSEIIDLCTSSNSIHERISEWIQMANPRPEYFRFSPTNGEGSLPLDTSDPTTLEKVEQSTEAYMNSPAIREQLEKLKQLLSAKQE